MERRRIVAPSEWLEERRQLLRKGKEFTRARDQLSEDRRALPWVKVEKAYVFEGVQGKETLSNLFEGRSQLIVYHFMFGPTWEEGCKSCSFWADNFNDIIVHLNQRDVTMVAVSRAPIDRLTAFKERMGWTFKWVSSLEGEFNQDFHVSFPPEALTVDVFYNFTHRRFPSEEAPGVSVFFRDEIGAIFHTCSCYARGLDMLNTAYQYLDLVPKGRDEAQQPYTMSWVRHHDRYDA